VVAGGGRVETELVGPPQEAVELEMAVALHARVRRTTERMVGHVRLDHVTLEVVSEVEHDMIDAEACMSRSAGHCMTMGTASTMASMVEALGMGLPTNAAIPAVDSRRKVLARMAGRRIVEMVHENLKMSKILTRDAFENAIMLNRAIGGSKIMIREAARHATQRRQFGSRIADFEMIRAKFARMVVSTYALESMVYLTAGLIDRGLEDYSLEGACCKVFGTEAVWSNINDALQIAGGNGFMEDYPYEKALRDSRVNMIFEGTNEILRVLLALSGMRDVGEDMKEIGKALKDPLHSFGILGDYAARKGVAVPTPPPAVTNGIADLGREFDAPGALSVLFTHIEPAARKALLEEAFTRWGESFPFWYFNILYPDMLLRLTPEVQADLLLEVEVKALAGWCSVHDPKWQEAFLTSLNPSLRKAVRSNMAFASRAEQLRMARRGHVQLDARGVQRRQGAGRAHEHPGLSGRAQGALAGTACCPCHC